MGFKHAAIGLAGLAAVGLSVATPAATINTGSIVINFADDTIFGTPSISNSGSQVTFSWSIPSSVSVVGLFNPNNASFTLPDYSVTASAGHQLSGPILGFVGNLAYTEAGGSSVSASVVGTAVLDFATLGAGNFAFGKNETVNFDNGNSGFLSVSPTLPVGNFTQFGFQDATLNLNVFGEGFGQVFAQPQNLFSVTFTSTPVPVPAALWLLTPALAGLATRRRRRKA